jgi:hypothetical protein
MKAPRQKLFKAVLLAILIVSFGVSGLLQKQMNLDRAKFGLTRRPPLENAPPILAFTTGALGGFRGLIANALWIRASELQEKDRYFEMAQLADWITKLEPHYVHVWMVQAWNMAYNISVKFKDYPDRWRWVRNGIELLRDQGLVYNPDETLLYRELAWFFQHKMGQNLDDAHMHYKIQWAHEMTGALGGEKPNYPELLNPTTPEAAARAKNLKSKYKMDPVIMKQVDEKYGPLEWRLPESHAIYWAYLGLQKAKREELITLRRVIYQSMQTAFMRGALIEDKMSGQLMLGYNLDMTENANASYQEMMSEDPEQKEHIANAHKNFLKNVPYFFFIKNRRAEAERWFKILKEKYPVAVPSHLTLEDYAIHSIFAEDISETNVDRVKAAVDSLLVNYFVDLATDEDDRAMNYHRMAMLVHKEYMGRIRGSVARVGLPEFEVLKRNVLEQLLDPEEGLQPQFAAVLRTKLNLPAPQPVPEEKPEVK